MYRTLNAAKSSLVLGIMFCLTLLVFVMPAQAVIMIDNPGTGVSQSVNSNMLSIPGFVVGSGDNRMLVVTAGGEVGNGDILNVTYGSQNFTRGAFVREAGANVQFAEIWWLANPDSGANTITATLDSSNLSWAMSAVSLENVLQTGPVDSATFGSPTSAGVASSSLSLDVSGLNPLVVEALSSNAGVVMSPLSGQAAYYSLLSGGGGGYSHLGAIDTIFGGSPTSQDWSLSPTQRLAHVGVVFVEVPPPPAPEPSSLLLLGFGVLGLVRQARRQR